MLWVVWALGVVGVLGGSHSPTPSTRHALFWMVPYGNITGVEGYERMWHQWKSNSRPGYLMAGSAYAAKRNGSLGYATTSAGEATFGIDMERYGFPALKKMGLTTLGMVYVTHFEAISKIVANPDPFIAQLVAKAHDHGLDGFDIDYEPQSDVPPSLSGTFMGFMGKLADAMKAHNLLLTIDISNCPSWQAFQCQAGAALPGLTQANTMSSFGVRSVEDFARYVSVNQRGLGEKWAPGFEPANQGSKVYPEILQYMLHHNVTTLSTWEVHESNVGDQPQWLFDAINAFLDGTL